MNFQMIPVISVVNWLRKNFKVVAVGLVSLLIATIFYQHNQLQNKNREIDRITNNIRAYEEIASNAQDNSRVLQLTIDELNHSKDSLIQQVDKVKKELKIKDKNLTDASVINTEIKDSVKTVIKEKLIDFNEELKLNDLTTIIVSRKDSILTAKIDIKNQQIIFIEDRKEYRNKYKNGFIRFLHFDWKKIRIKKYTVKNSNPLIKVTDTRIVEINKKE